ncbi:glycoside hydrolase family 113 [Bradyrhizobium sp. STM 3562]|uniref:glycoside hydrolase family 113 n=1 Tax=Bradyrhizobium sp. STM 3562 TaxID=578924 RepID=UPI00388EC857
MANLFDVQGFGALSEWNGQFSSASANQAFQTIASLGSNSVELTVRIWTDSHTSNDVFAQPQKTESDASLLAGFQAAEAAGLSVVFKAAISPLDGSSTYSLAPSDVATFFANYKAEIVHLATIAQEGGVATFAIGNEMGSLTGAQYRSYWTDIIAAVRQVYHGEITYAAATDEASHVSFWDQVDTIGVNTYPPLTSSETPTVQDLIHAWTEVPYNPYYAAAFEYKSPVDFLHSLSEQYNKPVLMTEMGYRSIEGTAISPSSLSTNVTADANAQADAYNAFFQVWATHGGSWLKGVELWQWDLNNQYNTTGFSPMGKPAETLVSQYFHDQGSIPSLTVNATPIAGTIDVGDSNNVINANLGDKVIHVGDGDNTIHAGPTTLAPLQTTTITLTGWGSVVNGVGAQAQILVNGQPVSGVFEFTPATDPSGYQTYTVTFDNSTVGAVNSVDIALLNATSGRALHVKDFSINGVALSPSDATNASSPGTFDLYVRTIHFDTTSHQDWFVGDATANDTVYGGAGNDVVYVGAGNDTIDGGGGTNTAVFQGNLGDYSISFAGNETIVTDNASGVVDHLTNIQSLQFADTAVNVGNLATTTDPGDSVQIAATAGGTTTETIRHTDGSRDLYVSDITGKAYVAEHDTISAGGATTLIERFFGNDQLAFKQVVNSDGSVSTDSYDDAGHLLQFAIRHADGSYDQFNFNTSGALTGETERASDGSRQIDTYGIAGQDYTSQHVATDASGHSTLVEQYRSDGSLLDKQTVDASGVKTLDQYDASGHLTQETVAQADGSVVQSTYASDGTLTGETQRHADGSRDIYTYGIVGKDYTSQHVFNDASGHSLLIEQYRGDGSLLDKQTVDASGITTSDQYDGPGQLTQQTITQTDGTFVQSNYAADGSLAEQTSRHLDGSRTVDTYGITGQAYSARHDVIDPSGHTVATTFDNKDGSHTMTAYTPGVTLTSTAGNDVMNSASGDNFVFTQTQPAAHDVINNFKVGDALGHDVLEISSTTASDFAHLSVEVVGHDTVIDLGHGASVTLAGVTAPLTAHDVLIV